MRNSLRVRVLCFVLLLSVLCLCAGCARKEAPRSTREIIEEMVVDYGSYGAEADGRVAELLGELRAVDADAADRWERIMPLWKEANTDLSLNYDVLPDGLPDTDELCIVVLGFQLNPDGSMRDELIQRLTVAKRCAEKYPNALIVCTGGGTAAEDKTATEAGRMAEWLLADGIAPHRVIVEDKSLTTAQNAIYTFDILAARYPQVRQLALRAERADARTVSVSSNAAWHAPSGSLSAMFQAGALIELSGDVDTAFEIYYDTYDIHELPPLH